MNNGRGPYGDEHPVIKEECLNHVQKRMVTRLFDFRKKYNGPVKTKTGKTLFRSQIEDKNKLSDNIVHKIGKYYGCAVRKGAEDENNPVAAMKKDILATFFHLTSNDSKNNHLYCPTGEESWCFFNKAVAKSETPQSHKKMKIRLDLTEEQQAPVLQVIEDLSNDDLLKKCLKKRTQNVSESFNSKVWNKCPKVRLHGIDKATCAFYLAALEHNVGYTVSTLAPEIRGCIGAGFESLKRKVKNRERKSLQQPPAKRKRMMQNLLIMKQAPTKDM